MDRPVRRIQREVSEQKSHPRGSYIERLGGVIEGNVAVDVAAGFAQLNEFLHSPVARTFGAIDSVLERAGPMHDLAKQIETSVRADYEALKDVHATWLESKRTAARIALEEEKARGDLKKQISESMIMDVVRANWPDEYAVESKKLREMQALTHRVESLSESIRIHARAHEARMNALRGIDRS